MNLKRIIEVGNKIKNFLNLRKFYSPLVFAVPNNGNFFQIFPLGIDDFDSSGINYSGKNFSQREIPDIKESLIKELIRLLKINVKGTDFEEVLSETIKKRELESQIWQKEISEKDVFAEVCCRLSFWLRNQENYSKARETALFGLKELDILISEQKTFNKLTLFFLHYNLAMINTTIILDPQKRNKQSETLDILASEARQSYRACYHLAQENSFIRKSRKKNLQNIALNLSFLAEKFFLVNKEFQTAKEFTELAIQFLSGFDLPDFCNHIFSFFVLGKANLGLQDFSEALRNVQEGVNLYSRLKESNYFQDESKKKGEEIILRNLVRVGHNFRQKERNEEALFIYQQVLELGATQVGTKLNLYYGLGRVYRNLRRKKESIRFYLRLLNLLEIISEKHSLHRGKKEFAQKSLLDLFFIAQSFYQTNKFAKAEYLFKKILKYTENFQLSLAESRIPKEKFNQMVNLTQDYLRLIALRGHDQENV